MIVVLCIKKKFCFFQWKIFCDLSGLILRLLFNELNHRDLSCPLLFRVFSVNFNRKCVTLYSDGKLMLSDEY